MKSLTSFLIIAVLCVSTTLATNAQQDDSPLTRKSSSTPANLQSNIVPGQNFDGLGENSFGIMDSVIPPDPAGAVGITQYVQWVNTWIAVFNKGTGEIISGPTPGNAIWTSMGGPCATYNDGQPVVQFDKLAQRWVIGQLVLHGPPYYFCVAVSTTSDATGSYYLYSITLNDIPDSPRLATWPDAYYVTFNMLNSSGGFIYANVCALDRNSLLNGQTPRGPLCTQPPPQYGSLLPADVDSNTPPPSGWPNLLLNLGQNALNFWTYDVNFSTGMFTLSGPTPIPVAPFSPACASINCIDQKGTGQRLTALSNRLMYRLAYRNFGTYYSLTVDHTVIFALRYAAVRWYELQGTSQSPPPPPPSVYQYGTYTPTSIHRWLGNIAMDSMSDIAIAYNFSSIGLHPSFNFTDREASDTLGQLRGENLIMAGTGSQTAGYQWGNSTSLSVDPVDDCTFWTTGEYLRSDGTVNWNTRVSSFSLSTCPSSNPAIQITSAPPFGQDELLQGTVSGINVNDYEVGILLFIPGIGWVSKPTCAQLFVPISSSGTWQSPVDSGGAGDLTATKYAAYLVPDGTQASCWLGIDGLPFDLETEAVARAYFNRPNPAPYVQFSGLSWEVTQNPYKQLQPGSCLYSPDNVFVDSGGNLHLLVTQNNQGTWTCAQVGAPPQPQQGQQVQQTYGYGTYTFNLASAVNNLDPNIVLGLFTWSDDPAYAPYQNGSIFQAYSPWANNPYADMQGSGIVPSHSELDVEFSTGLVHDPPNNSQFCVQPYTTNPCHPFVMPPGYPNSTAIISWLPDGISFTVQDPNHNILAQWSYTGPVPPPGENGGWLGPVPSLQQVRMNLWIINPPQNGAEVVISNFSYVPYAN